VVALGPRVHYFAPDFPASPTRSAGENLEVPNTYRIPVGWLLAHGGEVVRYRTFTELAPSGTATPETLAAAQAAAEASKGTQTILKKQKDTGLWGGNLLGLAVSAAHGIKDIGTIAQYRRLVELGSPRSARAFKLADRLFYRLLSRDEDPALLFELQKGAKGDEAYVKWARGLIREAATAALAEAGEIEAPPVRGAAHRIVSEVSEFLRSPLAEKPFVKSGGSTVLHPEANPPTWYALAMVAAMPSLQRERAGFTERLAHYLSSPQTKKAFVVLAGKKKIKPTHLVLGDPVAADWKGVPKDIPLALHFIDLLVRIGAFAGSPNATRVLGRLMKDVDDRGVWNPKGLRAAPKPVNRYTYHMFPLDPESKAPEWKQVDVTFRLAQIARRLGWQIEYV